MGLHTLTFLGICPKNATISPEGKYLIWVVQSPGRITSYVKEHVFHWLIKFINILISLRKIILQSIIRTRFGVLSVTLVHTRHDCTRRWSSTDWRCQSPPGSSFYTVRQVAHSTSVLPSREFISHVLHQSRSTMTSSQPRTPVSRARKSTGLRQKSSSGRKSESITRTSHHLQ